MFSGCAPTDRFFENVLRLLVVGACPRPKRKFSQKLILSTNPFWHVGTLDRSQMTLCWVNSMSDANTEEHGVPDTPHPLGANHIAQPSSPKRNHNSLLPTTSTQLAVGPGFVCLCAHSLPLPDVETIANGDATIPQIPHAGMCWLVVHATLVASEF